MIKYNLEVIFLLKRTVLYKDNLITYYIVKKNKIKNWQLSISKDYELILTVPKNIDLNFVENVVKTKGLIFYNRYKKINNIKDKEASIRKKEYITGESINILGKKYTINLTTSEKTSIFCENTTIYIQCPKESTKIERLNLIKSFLYKKAQVLFREILEEVLPLFHDYNLPYPHLTIREMKTRWGSCSFKKNRISLNLYLMQFPKDAIKQVVIHEMCHFIQPNHSKKFYELMDKFMPNWEEMKNLIDTTGTTSI